MFDCLEDEPTYCTQKVVRSDFGNESDEEEKSVYSFDKRHNRFFLLFSTSRTGAADDQSNNEDSPDEAVENTFDKRPQYKSIMNNIRRGVRTDDEANSKKRVNIDD